MALAVAVRANIWALWKESPAQPGVEDDYRLIPHRFRFGSAAFVCASSAILCRQHTKDGWSNRPVGKVESNWTDIWRLQVHVPWNLIRIFVAILQLAQPHLSELRNNDRSHPRRQQKTISSPWAQIAVPTISSSSSRSKEFSLLLFYVFLAQRLLDIRKWCRISIKRRLSCITLCAARNSHRAVITHE